MSQIDPKFNRSKSVGSSQIYVMYFPSIYIDIDPKVMRDQGPCAEPARQDYSGTLG